MNSRVLIAHGCSCVFFIFFGCHPFSLLSGFPCPKRKIKVIFSEVRARFLGIKWLPPGARTQPKKQVWTLADLVGGFVSCAAIWLQNLYLGEQMEIPEFLVSLDSTVICLFST